MERKSEIGLSNPRASSRASQPCGLERPAKCLDSRSREASLAVRLWNSGYQIRFCTLLAEATVILNELI